MIELKENPPKKRRQKTEEKVSREFDILRAILESTADGILVVDNVGRILHYNENFLKMWKINKEMLEKEDNKEFFYSTKNQLLEADNAIEKVEKSIDNPNNTSIIFFKDGRVYEYFTRPLIINHKVSGSVKSYRDITNQMNMIQSLKIKNKIIETSLNPIVYTDMTGKITYVNQSFLDLFGYRDLEEVKNKNGMEFASNTEILAKMGHSLLNHGKWSGEVKGKRKDQSTFYAECFAHTLNDKDGKPVYIVIFLNDISLRKEMEEENKKIERLQQQTQLFSNISHELKTPLNIILGAIQLLNSLHDDYRESLNYNKINKYLWIMKQNCYRLLRLMNNLIDLTKVDNGFLKLKLGKYNIVDVVENITQSVVDYGKTKDIAIMFDTDIEEKILLIDPDKIERILLNLLSNSIKFTEKGGNITVAVHEYEDVIGISVKDTGIGIPEEQLGEVFERFMQVGSVFHHKNEGSGIGLSLVKALVEAHNGKITVRSKLGEGTEFIIQLPSKLQDDSISQDNEIEVTLTREVNAEKICTEFSDIYTTKI